MTTLGSQAVQDVCNCAVNVVAVFKDDPIRELMHPVQREQLDKLYEACKFLHELKAKA